MQFEFATAGRVVFGRGSLARLGTLCGTLGRRALVVTGANRDRAEPLRAGLRDAGVETVVFSTNGEPTLETVRKGRDLARQERCEWVLGFGGGSPIDAGKAIAALAANPGDVLDYLEVIGKAQPLPGPGLPYAAVPTTAGTGSEVTRNAVLGSPEHGVKASLRHESMLPRLALVDPALTDSQPRDVTAATGLDALTQLIEAFTCSRANPFIDSLCREGIRRAARSLPVVTGGDPTPEARDDMALAALFSGLALANAGLGAVHGFAGPIGGSFKAPHGAVCAALLAPVLRENAAALRSRAPAHPALDKLREVGSMLCPGAGFEQGLEWIERLVRDLGIPGLRGYGIGEEHLPELVRKASQASSMKANPIALTPMERESILRAAL